MNKTVLIVDDDEKLVTLVKTHLENEGYETLASYTGREALEVFRNRKLDLVILDLMLPELDGLTVCKRIRNESDVPIIMLTAKTEKEDRVRGLDIGADDYVTKPFSPEELMARVRAVLRRVEEEFEREEVSFGSLTINFPRHEVVVDGESQYMTSAEFEILSTLVKNPGRVFSRSQLLKTALDREFTEYDRSIDVHIRNLRKKIEPDPEEPRLIQTVYGVGYKFEPRET